MIMALEHITDPEYLLALDQHIEDGLAIDYDSANVKTRMKASHALQTIEAMGRTCRDILSRAFKVGNDQTAALSTDAQANAERRKGQILKGRVA
jgi:hypothetical protein